MEGQLTLSQTPALASPRVLQPAQPACQGGSLFHASLQGCRSGLQPTLIQPWKRALEGSPLQVTMRCEAMPGPHADPPGYNLCRLGTTSAEDEPQLLCRDVDARAPVQLPVHPGLANIATVIGG
mmetsp:Transcript_14043/g.39770  ORF Transcript_14043/g.39770 Transcript_14043/m.39770 type:complete len:124 (-) Transcript_14043:157-528(-)